MPMENVVVGIDLGTTNSCVAVVKDGRPKIIEDERGYNILPSCVAYKSKGKFVVGHGAKAMILTSPAQTAYAVKRVIGRKYNSPEVQEAVKRLTYDFIEGEGQDVLVRLGEVELTPSEIASIILKCIKEVAERHMGANVTQAVISVPAYFNHAQRTATIEAARLADLECLRLINEPTAAALAYGFKKDLEKRVAVYDLGGGTFDISVLDIGAGVYETLATGGNSYLGGEDFDYRVVDYLADQFKAEHGVDLREDRMSLQRLKDAAERAKCELSFVDKTPILVPRIFDNLNLETTLTRETLETLVDDLIKETIRLTSEALRDANVTLEELDEIILVGGMTRMPKVQEAIRVFFGMAPCKGVHPEEVVAIGSAVQAFSLEDEADGHLLLDVTPFSLGIDTAGGYMGTVVDRNTTLPVSMTRTFTTVRDNQEVVKVVVRQGEGEKADENEALGEFSLEGIREASKMEPRIDVTFKIDANGILHVTAMDRDTGEAQTVNIRDYMEKAAGEVAGTTDVQLAKDLESGATAGGEGGPPKDAEASGIFGRLKGLFGKQDGKAAPVSSATGEPGTEVADRSAASPAESATDVADRSDSSPAPDPGTDVADRRADEAPAPPTTTEVADRDAPADEAAWISPDDVEELPSSTEVAERGAPDAAAGEPGIADDLRASFDQLGADDPDATAVAPRAADGGVADLGGDAMIPVDDLPAPAPDGFDGGSLDGDDDPFAVRERPQLDPFGMGAGGPDPFGGEGAGDAGDPFASNVEHSRKTRKSAGVNTLPMDFDPADSPVTHKAAGKKPARLKIRYKKAATFVNEFTENLERGGTFIKTGKPLECGRRCHFELTVPGKDDPVRIRGMVVWSSRGIDELPDGQKAGMGVRYEVEDAQGLADLAAAVKDLTE